MSLEDDPSERSAAEQLEAVGREAARVAHDLNNLLQIIVGFGDTLAAELPVDSPQQRAATNILNAATTATARARQLVALGRRARAIPALLDASVATLALAPAIRRRGGNGLRLRFTLPDTPMPIRVAPRAFEQLVLSVIAPTDASCPDARTLALSVARVIHSDTDAAARRVPAGSYIEVMLRDTCAAPIACGAVELDVMRPDGGYATCAPTGRRGRVVRLGFAEPVWDPDTWTDLPVRDTVSAAALPMSEAVLIVSDDITTTDAIRPALTRAGYHVEHAQTVADATGWLQQHAADVAVVLGDVRTVDASLEAHLCGADIALLRFSASEGAAGSAGGAGRAAALVVPCTPPTLVAALRDALTR